MLDFQLKVVNNKSTVGDCFEKIEAFCQELVSYGYDAWAKQQEIDRHRARVCIAGLNADGEAEVYMDEDVELVPEFVNRLAKFTMKAHAQYTLDELAPRLDLIGCNAVINSRPNTATHGYVRVVYGGNKATSYAPTYEDMAKLRYDIDVAEVHYLIGANFAKMEKAGWRRLGNQDFYGFTRPKGDFVTVAFNRPDEARKAIATLEADLAGDDCRDII